MKKIKFFAALWVSKAVLLLCNLLKSRGSTTPGRIALKICPDFITVSAKKVKEKNKLKIELIEADNIEDLMEKLSS